MQNICIVGGSGFIGTRLCQRLAATHGTTSTIVDKRPSAAFPGRAKLADVRSITELRSAIPQGSVLVNLAAEHRDDVRPRSLYDEVNVTGAVNLCQVAREKDVKTIVFTSSVAVYGFADVGTDESGRIAPFNDYGRTKHEAEQIFRQWQSEEPSDRTLVIVRPTVVFGERNRGNVYNLLRQIAVGRFVMVGHGRNRKSMAYVENVAAFLEFALEFEPGVHVYNFVDKPDFTMNALVGSVNEMLGRFRPARLRLPFVVGYVAGLCFDLASQLTGRKFPISAIRVRKFCANSVYSSAIDKTGYVAPVPLAQALRQTVHHEFIERHDDEALFYTE